MERDDNRQPMKEQTVAMEKRENTLTMRRVPLIIEFEELYLREAW